MNIKELEKRLRTPKNKQKGIIVTCSDVANTVSLSFISHEDLDMWVQVYIGSYGKTCKYKIYYRNPPKRSLVKFWAESEVANGLI